MKLTEFLEAGQERWEELEQLLGKAGRRPERMSPAQIRRLGRLYRAVAADVAYARRAFPHDPVVTRLERLATMAGGVLYQRSDRRANVLGFLADTYWRLLYERRRQMALAALLLLVPAAVGALWALGDPRAASAALPPEFQWVTQAGSTDQGLGTVGLAGFSTFVMSNNIRVALVSFALGITWGLGTAAILLQNGFFLGGIVGLGVGSGHGRLVAAATTAHGFLELSCLVVAGAAGLALGRSMLRPGTSTRRAALGVEAVAAFRIAAGTAPWLVVAGLIEGYVSRVGLGWVPTSVVGLVAGGAFWGLYLWRGIPGSQRRAARLARR